MLRIVLLFSCSPVFLFSFSSEPGDYRRGRSK